MAKFYPIRVVNMSAKNVTDRLRQGDKIVRYINAKPRGGFKYRKNKRKLQSYSYKQY